MRLKITLPVLALLATGVACIPMLPSAPYQAGKVGLTVDADGHLTVVLAWCEGATPEDVHVNHPESPSGVALADTFGDYHLVTDAEYRAPDLDGGLVATFRLNLPDNGWTAEPGPPTLKPGVMYFLGAGRGRGVDRINAMGVQFTTDDLKQLTPGQVLVQRTREVPLPTPIDEASIGIVFYSGPISQQQFNQEGQNPADCQPFA
ncbi:hypothetical protein Aple_023920 [Acrocarpospora pleiomorpha]|uniref:Lipoprotein n=1 Tax=Acrocarpospora pleiomorpha TaxID=90975 RepID=A0A5M3XFS6_9ACTN|nr:hypothetical protein [Acrocarpospora pleiomorpha]GES19496.1 hypothetical protein Aple_023920 [Acrocarpospora pleiomorpha]